MSEWFSGFKFCKALGQGGMGVIYLAEDRARNNALCVIKQLIDRDSDPLDREDSVRFFQREAQMLSHLDHPGIVRLLDYHVSDDNKYFLVMNYVPGKDLDFMVKNDGKFSSEATVEIGIQCCEILEYLHEREKPIIYRDLKPSNLMLTPEGQIVFIDFGIARQVPQQAATRVVTTGYSPPEQYTGHPGRQSDLYALGATLGHLLTGVRPRPLTVSAPILLEKDVLPSLDNLIRRLTASAPEDRPASAKTVRYELYCIYREMHPDFVVPDESLLAQSVAENKALYESNVKIQERLRNSALHQVHDAGYNAVDQLSERSTKIKQSLLRRCSSILSQGIKKIMQLFTR
jgi:serine/threonine-protein kinase